MKDFSKIASPLMKLIRISITRYNNVVKVFEELKQRLTTTLVFAIPDGN